MHHDHPYLSDLYFSSHRADLLAEAEHDRLVALATGRSRSTGVRHELAVVCHRLADWLDDSGRYAQASDTGRSDWVRGLTSA